LSQSICSNAPDAIMVELLAFKRQANAAADFEIKKLLKRIVRETQAKLKSAASSLDRLIRA
jgi:hypothetical protein